MASKEILMKARAEIDGTHTVLMEEHIVMGLFITVWVELRNPKKEAKHPGNSNKNKPLSLLDLKENRNETLSTYER